MKVAVLTSSRADFGIYLPLLHVLKDDAFFDLSIVAFGTHLSPYHGYTKRNIEAAGFEVDFTVESLLLSDSKESISTSMGLTMEKFAAFWAAHQKKFDWVICLGDRYEMFAAVMAGVPFQIKFAHLHGGEKTLGAIDNVFRHGITHACKLHFTATEEYKARVEELIDEELPVYNVGSLSLDNLLEMDLLDCVGFEKKWGIDLSQPTALVTFHPETVKAEDNRRYAGVVCDVIQNHSELQFLITMPNADTAGSIVRQVFIDRLSAFSNVHLKENLGTLSYFSAMKHSLFLMGNTSSGIIEAASFKKYVLNLGGRQEGRLCSENVIQLPIVENEINKGISQVLKNPLFEGDNVYFNGGAKNVIVEVLKNHI